MTAWAYLDHAGPLPIAHRGGAGEAPENTIRAFERAWDLGYRYLETDAQVTKDGKLIAFHDDKVDRVTNGQGVVSGLSWNDIQRLRVEGEPIPLLGEIIATFPDARFHIDVKTKAAIAPLLSLLTQAKAVDKVCIGGFSERILQQVRVAFEGKVCSNLGRLSLFRVRLASWKFPARHPQGGAANIPRRMAGISLADPRFIRTAHKKTLPVHVWTINEAEEMRRLLDIGADGIFTDVPSLLKEVLQERNEWGV